MLKIKIVSAILVLMLSLGILSACGGKEPAESPSESPTVTPANKMVIKESFINNIMDDETSFVKCKITLETDTLEDLDRCVNAKEQIMDIINILLRNKTKDFLVQPNATILLGEEIKTLIIQELAIETLSGVYFTEYATG